MSSQKPDKTMSSRLLTMKFMQRAAASNSSTPSSQVSHGKSTPRKDEETNYSTLSPKRQKVSNGSDFSPSRNNADLEIISAAIKAEEEKRAAAVARQAAEAGETEWVLEFPVGTALPATDEAYIVSGNGSIALGEVDDEPMEYEGRRSYGNFKRKKKVEESAQPKIAPVVKSRHRPEPEEPQDGSDEEDESDEGEEEDEEEGEEKEEDHRYNDLNSMMRTEKANADRRNRNWKDNNRKNKGHGNGSFRSGNPSSGRRSNDDSDLSRLRGISSLSGVSKPSQKFGGKKGKKGFDRKR